MHKVQVIGLPGSGKTTGIFNFTSNMTHKPACLDIRDVKGKRRELKFKRQIERSKKNTIAESACGVLSRGTSVIQLKPPIKDVYAQLLKRDGVIDEDYLSLLTTTMVPAHYTISSSDDLADLLKILLEC